MISPSLLRYHMEGLSKFITILPGGGSCQFITILQWGGVSRDPKFVLRNIWTAPYMYRQHSPFDLKLYKHSVSSISTEQFILRCYLHL